LSPSAVLGNGYVGIVSSLLSQRDGFLAERLSRCEVLGCEPRLRVATVPVVEIDEVVTTVSPIFARAGSAWYFQPETLEAGRKLGLDGFRFYFLGRGGVLGDVGWEVVHAAFGYFKPSLVQTMWVSARETCSPEEGARAHLQAAAEFGRAKLAGLGDLGAFNEAAAKVVEAARADFGGLSLFAGYASQDVPEDAPARAIHLISVLRELRGSVHLCAVVASGLATPVAHAISRPTDVAMFGWGEAEVPEPTSADRERHARAEADTDAALRRFYALLDGAESEALVAGARSVAQVIGS